jgi:hypothetical protein
MQNLIKAKLPTPRLDGRPGAHAIRKHRYYLEDDGNLTPSEAAKTKRAVVSKPVYILALSREEAIKKLVAWLKDDRRLSCVAKGSKKPKKKKDEEGPLRHPRVDELVDGDLTDDKDEAFEKDVLKRMSISPLASPPHLVVSDSWRLALEGIFLEMIRIFWLLSRRRQLKDVTIDDRVKEVSQDHPVVGFLLTSASSAIDVVLSDETSPSRSSVSTTLSYLTADHKDRVDFHLVLNERGVKAMGRFVDYFSRPSEMKAEVFDSINVRLVVSSSRHFSIEPYLRLKAISYLS